MQVLNSIQIVYGKYQHLDKLLSSCGEDEEFTLHMLREFWTAIKEYNNRQEEVKAQ
jgi:hypothetical protein